MVQIGHVAMSTMLLYCEMQCREDYLIVMFTLKLVVMWLWIKPSLSWTSFVSYMDIVFNAYLKLVMFWYFECLCPYLCPPLKMRGILRCTSGSVRPSVGMSVSLNPQSCKFYPKLCLTSGFMLTKSTRTVTLQDVQPHNVTSGRPYATAEVTILVREYPENYKKISTSNAIFSRTADRIAAKFCMTI